MKTNKFQNMTDDFASRIMNLPKGAGTSKASRGHATPDMNRGYIDGSKASRYAGARTWIETFKR